MQTELSPVPVVGQICLLLALTEGLFDDVPLDKMCEAEKALATASAQIPPDARIHLLSNQKLTDTDRAAILKIARDGLTPFAKKS